MIERFTSKIPFLNKSRKSEGPGLDDTQEFKLEDVHRHMEQTGSQPDDPLDQTQEFDQAEIKKHLEDSNRPTRNQTLNAVERFHQEKTNQPNPDNNSGQ